MGLREGLQRLEATAPAPACQTCVKPQIVLKDDSLGEPTEVIISLDVAKIARLIELANRDPNTLGQSREEETDS